MTATTAPTASSASTTRGEAAGSSPWRLRFRGVLKAERIKLVSVRSNIVTLLSAAVALVGFGMLFSSFTGSSDNPAPPGGGLSDSLSVAFAGMNLAQLILGVLGALLVTSEYASGLIRTMFAAVPKRIPVLLAKAVVVGVATWVVMTAAAFVTFFAAQAVYAGDGATYAITDDGALRVVFGVGIFGAGVALLGVALGFLLRSTASAVATLVGLLLIAPGLAGLLPDSVGDTVTKLLPSNAASSFTSLTPDEGMLGSGAGLVVLGIWVVGLLAVAAWSLRRRDA